MQYKNLIDLVIQILHSVGVVKKCELSRSTVLKSFTHKQKADNPVFPSCSPLKVFEVTYTCTYKTCILFTKTEVVSRVAIQSLNGECTFICIKTQGICQLPQRKHGCAHAVQAEEAFDGRKSKSYKKKKYHLIKSFLLATCCRSIQF